MWELDWAQNDWCFQIVLLKKTLESPLDCKENQPVNHKGSQPWIFIGKPDVAADPPILWPPDGKSQLIDKDPDAGKDWEQEEKGVTENEMVKCNIDSMDMSLNKLLGIVKAGKPGVLQSKGSQIVGQELATELQHQCNAVLVRFL